MTLVLNIFYIFIYHTPAGGMSNYRKMIDLIDPKVACLDFFLVFEFVNLTKLTEC